MHKNSERKENLKELGKQKFYLWRGIDPFWK